MKLDALPQLDLHRRSIDRRHRLGQLEDQLVRLVRPHRRPRQIAEHESLDDQLTQIGVRGRIPIAGQRFGAEKSQRLAFGRESGIYQKVRVDPSEAERCSTGEPLNITSLRLIMSYPSMILATLKLLPRARGTQPFRSSRATPQLQRLNLQSVDQRPRLPDSCCSTIPLLTLPDATIARGALLITQSAPPNSEAAAPLHCAGQE